VYALLLLQVLDHREQVTRLGVSFWPEHVSGSKINPELVDAGTHTREITLPHPMDGCRHLNRSGHIQTIEPFGIRTVSLSIEVFSSLYHMTYYSRIYVTFCNTCWKTL